MTDRNLYFQKIRGISIITVILIHTLNSVYTKDLNNVLVLRQLINFPVAVFFFISGYFIKESDFFEIGGIKKFISKRMIRIVIPYLIWSVLGIIFMDNFYGFNMRLIVLNLVKGYCVYPYYFMIVMMQFILITPIIIKAMKSKLFSNLLWFITPASIVALYIVTFIMGKNIFFPYNVLPFTMWFSFYYYGIVVGSKEKIEMKIYNNIQLNAILYVAFLIISILEGQILNNNFNSFSFGASQIKISSALYAFFLINIFIWGKNKFKNSKANNILVLLGNYSFGIFLIHPFILTALNNTASYILKSQKFSFIVTTSFGIITLAISYLIIKITPKIIGKKYSKIIFGF